MSHTQLLIVSHYPLFDQGLRASLSRQTGVEVVGVCRDLETAITQARTLRPDILVVISEPEVGRRDAAPSRESALRRLNGLAPTLIQIDLADNSMQIHRRQPAGPTVLEMEQATLDDLVGAIQASAEGQSLDLPEHERGQR
jgi:DNA-binding NarL/FixJ family response regulator